MSTSTFTIAIAQQATVSTYPTAIIILDVSLGLRYPKHFIHERKRDWRLQVPVLLCVENLPASDTHVPSAKDFIFLSTKLLNQFLDSHHNFFLPCFSNCSRDGLAREYRYRTQSLATVIRHHHHHVSQHCQSKSLFHASSHASSCTRNILCRHTSHISRQQTRVPNFHQTVSRHCQNDARRHVRNEQ